MSHNVLLLPGDGVGPEIMQATINIINVCNQYFSTNINYEQANIGGAAIDASGSPLPQDTLKLAQSADGILLGAVGGPKWDNVSMACRPEKALLKIRQALGLFANLRPAIMFPELVHASTLKPEFVENLDMLTVRELTGGIYYGEPRGITDDNGRVGTNTMVYHEDEIKRVAHVAFDLASKRNKRLCSVDKANVLEVSQLWRQVVTEVGQHYPDIELTHMYVDNAAMQLVRAPKQFDVLLMGNMFGDIISDCSAMLTGSIGMLPSASMNDSNKGLFEPVHGSAPDIAGQDSVNPCAMILSFAMMLEYSLEQSMVAQKIKLAIANVLAAGYKTKDIAGNGKSVSTTTMADKIVTELKGLS